MKNLQLTKHIVSGTKHSILVALFVITLPLISACQSDYEAGYKDGYEDALYEVPDGYWSLDSNEYAEYAYCMGYTDGNLLRYPQKYSGQWMVQHESSRDNYIEGYKDGYNTIKEASGKVYLIDVSDKSDAIIEVGYLEEPGKAVFVRWAQGDLYAYYDVSFDTFIDIVSSDSVGEYVNSNLKEKYEYAKIGDGKREDE